MGPLREKSDVFVGRVELVFVVVQKCGIDGGVRVVELVGRECFQDLDAFCRPADAVEGEGVGDRGRGVIRRFFVGLLREGAAGGGVVIEEQGKTRGIGSQADLFGRDFV